MLKFSFVVLLFAISSSSLCHAADHLKFDPSNYNVEEGCFDPATNAYRRTQLFTAAEIQERLESKDFECTEISDVLISGNNTRALYSSNGPGGLKVVFLSGSGGALGQAGVTGFNFNGAKITNLFMDYMMRMKGTVKGMNAKGVYLAFYAGFNPDSCSKPDNSESTLPSYASSDGSTILISLANKLLLRPDGRLFDPQSLQCK